MIIKAPNSFIEHSHKQTVFLAGTIDNGDSEDWQKKVGEYMSGNGYVVLNPRRDDWNPNWDCSEDNPEFLQQVVWELDAMESSKFILFNFLPDSKSPVTMLELGLMKDHENVCVICPKEFWRSGNVRIVCARYGFICFSTVDEYIREVHANV